MKHMAFLGIDPGQTGGLAVIYPTTHSAISISMPLAGKELDVQRILQWIQETTNTSDFGLQYNPICYIELVHSMPGQGVSSSFKFGFTTGVLHGIIRTLGIPLKTVTPQAWKKLILAGTDKSKQAAIDYCAKAHPYANLYPTNRCKKPSDGMAEAICIAEYAFRQEQ